MSEKINFGLLRDLYQKDETAEYIFDHLAERQRNHRVTSPERLMAILVQGGFAVSRSEVIRLFRKLEEAGCGKYVEGRRGHSSRFVWYVKMSDVGEAAKGSTDEIEEIPQDELAETDPIEDEETAQDTIEDDDDVLTHEFVLRPDFSVQLILPVDLRTAEAARVSDWVKTLPFE